MGQGGGAFGDGVKIVASNGPRAVQETRNMPRKSESIRVSFSQEVDHQPTTKRDSQPHTTKNPLAGPVGVRNPIDSPHYYPLDSDQRKTCLSCNSPIRTEKINNVSGYSPLVSAFSSASSASYLRVGSATRSK